MKKIYANPSFYFMWLNTLKSFKPPAKLTFHTLLLTIGLATISTQLSAQLLPNNNDFSRPEQNEHLSAGSSSSSKRGSTAFLQPSAALSFENRLNFKIGESIFSKLWVFSPSSTQASDGLGPLHNARSCIGCHTRGGRGHVPKGNWPADNAISMLMRLSIEARTDAEKALLKSGKVGVIAEPTYGTQLQDFAMQGLAAEGRININYSQKIVKLKGGTKVMLRKPSYSVTDLKYGPLDPSTKISVRIANPMLGLGFLEAIDERDILALADPNDENNDGISGRVNMVWQVATKSIVLGRFGWKAGSPSLAQQNSGAFATDMGLSTTLFPNAYQGDCSAAQTECLAAPDGRSAHLQGLEVASKMSQMLAIFVRNISVPERADVKSPQVLAGKALFNSTGCSGCHQSKFITSSRAAKGQASQLIWPYTDLLLHDMGPALADNRSEFQATGNEWRTA
ncbi:MAG: CxxC motif-containing protein (DUF1111 family), partial [Oceanospirillaceae bacterium]